MYCSLCWMIKKLKYKKGKIKRMKKRTMWKKSKAEIVGKRLFNDEYN